jgi:hypothetical protein
MAAITVKAMHEIFGHCSVKQLMKNKIMIAENVEKPHDLESCEPCKPSKVKRHVSRQPNSRTTKALDFLHIDTQEFKPLGIQGYRYTLIILDDFSRCLFVRTLHRTKR